MPTPMRLCRSLGVIALCTVAFTCPSLFTPARSGAQDQTPARATPQGAAVDLKVPKGTPDAITAILTRRSIRAYTPHPVPEDMIKLLLAAAMSAPSAFNERSTEFVVINDPKILDGIYRLNPNSAQVKRATVAILVCGNQDREKFKGKGYWQLDGAVAAENILIAAHALGLGAVWTAIYPYPERIPAVQKLLHLPEQLVPLTIIPIGYPAERKPPENRYDASRVRYNRW